MTRCSATARCASTAGSIHDMHLFEVKSPAQSKEAWDYYTLKSTIPAERAFRPLDQGGCYMVHT